MPWNEVKVDEQRNRFVKAAVAPASSMAALCREFGISRQTGYHWRKRYLENDGAAVTERSRRPEHSPRRCPEAVVEALIVARRERPDWGVRKLARILEDRHPELPTVSTSTLQRILEREGLIDDRDRQQIALQRFERQKPNELWQMDFKGPQGFNQASGPLSILDDHSRYLLALEQLPANTSRNVQGVLANTFAHCGLPEFLLLDHGKPWYDSVNVWGWSELTIWILRQGVQITFSGLRHPQTQGKVERMHGALQRAIRKRKPDPSDQKWLNAFRHEYNHERPHEGIGMTRPVERWQPSPRLFRAHPPEWQYPDGFEVCRLSGQGRLRYGGKRWEISRALRGQLVGVHASGASTLVYFCNMAVREIHLATGRSQALPGNPFRMLRM